MWVGDIRLSVLGFVVHTVLAPGSELLFPHLIRLSIRYWFLVLLISIVIDLWVFNTGTVLI